MLILKLLVPLMIAVSTCTSARSEVVGHIFQTGLCDVGDENACMELEEGQSCQTRDRTLSTTACNEVSSSVSLHSSQPSSLHGPLYRAVIKN